MAVGITAPAGSSDNSGQDSQSSNFARGRRYRARHVVPAPRPGSSTARRVSGPTARSVTTRSAAAQHGIDLLRKADYDGYYDLFDSESKKSIPRAAWINLTKCNKFSELVAGVTAGKAVVSGDTATVATRSDSGGAGRITQFFLHYESKHWRFHEAGHYFSPGTVDTPGNPSPNPSGSQCGK